MSGCYICRPDDPSADPEGCASCEQDWVEMVTLPEPVRTEPYGEATFGPMGDTGPARRPPRKHLLAASDPEHDRGHEPSPQARTGLGRRAWPSDNGGPDA